MTNVVEKKNIDEIASEVIEEILRIKDPFETITIVFHNMKVAQWFKAYYLKNRSEVMMNIEFKTLPVFINDMVNPDGRYKVMDNSLLRLFVIKVLMNPSAKTKLTAHKDFPVSYIYDASLSEIDGAHLYELSDKLASLYIQYENDEEDITGWEKDLYDLVMAEAEAKDCYTTKRLFEKNGISSPDKKTLIVNNSYITDLFKRIIDSDSSENITLLSVNNSDEEIKTNNPSIFSGPSILREVEGLHSRVCKIVKDNKDIRFNDILVYVQNIGDYTNSIKRVFDQYDKDFPSIPYNIVGESKEKQDMIDSLSILFDIANKEYFTRKDFYEFVKNSSIKYINKIDDTDIDEWMNIIVASNTYCGLDGRDDWDYLKKRTLLSSLVSEGSDVENVTELGGQKYIPISSIGLNEDSREKMINIIDELLSFTELFKGRIGQKAFDKTDIEKVREVLDSIYSIKGSDGEEKNYLYKEVSSELDYIQAIYDEIPANTLLYILMSAPSRYSSNPSEMFVSGITFIGLNSDDALSAKHVFMMGLNSKNFPRVEVKSEIDFSTKHQSSKELDENTLINICNAAENITFSYVNCDLEKDAELYKAELVDKLCAGVTEEKIPLDETRDYAELFTWKEFENKEYANNLLFGTKASASTATKRKIPEYQRETELTIRDFRDYAINAFAYKFNKVFAKNYDKEEKNNVEYRPIELDHLQDTIVCKEIIKINENINHTKECIDLMRVLPEGKLGNNYYNGCYADSDVVKKAINNGYSEQKLEPIEITAIDSNNNQHKWNMICNVEMYVKSNGNELYYIEPTKYTGKPRNLLNMFFYSLMEVAGRNDATLYDVYLGPYNLYYQIDSKEARERLGKLYLLMTDYKDLRYMDIQYLQTTVLSFLPTTLGGLKYKNNEKIHYTWVSEFSYRKLFDSNYMFGYTENDFYVEFMDFYNELRKLLNPVV